MDRIQRRDRWGLLVGFPIQNPELIRMAPELAGLPLLEQIHGLDVGTRRVWEGAKLFPEILRRLPKYRWIAWVFTLPGMSQLAQKLYMTVAVRRNRGKIGKNKER
jgi:hypothetical protein